MEKEKVNKVSMKCCDCHYFRCGDEETYDMCNLFIQTTDFDSSACDSFEEETYE